MHRLVGNQGNAKGRRNEVGLHTLLYGASRQAVRWREHGNPHPPLLRPSVNLAASSKAERTQIYDKAAPLLHVCLTGMPWAPGHVQEPLAVSNQKPHACPLTSKYRENLTKEKYNILEIKFHCKQTGPKLQKKKIIKMSKWELCWWASG